MKSKAFTLIELLVVISIIGVISSIVLVSFSGSRDKARLARAQQFDAQVSHALGAYAVGIWRFEEGSGINIYDESGYGNDGTFHGNPTPVFPAGVYSGTTALQFDGSNDYVSHSTTNINSRTGTVEGWVKPDTTSSWGFWQTHNSSGHNWVDWISMFSYTSGTFYFRMGNGSSCCSNDVTFTTADYIPADKWSHLVFTWEGTTMKVYVNGAVIASRTDAVFQNTVNPGARIGYGHDILMKGSIDDVRIYDEALSSAQIQQHYAAGAPSHGIAVK